MANIAFHNSETRQKAFLNDRMKRRGWDGLLIILKKKQVKSTGMHHSLPLMKLLGIFIHHLGQYRRDSLTHPMLITAC